MRPKRGIASSEDLTDVPISHKEYERFLKKAEWIAWRLEEAKYSIVLQKI